jgi:uncharacterized delta-60 repeat protein
MFLFIGSSNAQTLLRDTDFNYNSQTTNSETRCLLVLTEGDNRGKILAGGHFNAYNGNFNYNKLVRLNDDGTVDDKFAPQDYTGGIFTIAIQPWDNKIIVGGSFTKTVGGVTYNNIIRLNENGSVDNTFIPSGGGTNGVVWKVLVLDEMLSTARRIVIGGVYTSYSGTTIGANQGGVILVRENGSLAKNCNVNEGAWTSGGVYTMALDNNGKILIGGEFGVVGSVKVRRAARLNRNGDFDNTFINVGYDGVGPSSSVYSIAAQPSDNKILIGGAFTSYVDMTIGQYVNNTRTRIARLNVDGTLDKDFNFSSGNFMNRGFNDNAIKDILFSSTGKIIVAGNFTSYGGTTVNRIARLFPNGDLDNNFNVGTGFDNLIHDIAFYPFFRGEYVEEGQMLVSGSFVNFNSFNRQPNLLRLMNTEVLSTYAYNLAAVKLNDGKVKLSWNMKRPNAIYELQRSDDAKNFKVIKSYTSTIAENSVITYDELKSTAIVYYRLVVKSNSDLGFGIASETKEELSATISILNQQHSELNIWKSNTSELKLSFTSKLVDQGKFQLQIVSLAGQQILKTDITINKNNTQQTIAINANMKNCFAIVSNNKGQVLKYFYIP